MPGGSPPRSLLSDWCRPWAFSRVELSQRFPHSGFDVAVDLNQVTVSSSDLSRSEEFYSRLGLRLIVRSDHYLRFECPSGASTFSVELQSAPSGTGITVYFETDQLDALCQRLEGEGLVFDHPPTDMPWLWREARIRDPDGHELCLYHAGQNRKHPPWRLP